MSGESRQQAQLRRAKEQDRKEKEDRKRRENPHSYYNWAEECETQRSDRIRGEEKRRKAVENHDKNVEANDKYDKEYRFCQKARENEVGYIRKESRLRRDYLRKTALQPAEIRSSVDPDYEAAIAECKRESRDWKWAKECSMRRLEETVEYVRGPCGDAVRAKTLARLNRMLYEESLALVDEALVQEFSKDWKELQLTKRIRERFGGDEGAAKRWLWKKKKEEKRKEKEQKRQIRKQAENRRREAQKALEDERNTRDKKVRRN